MLSRRSFLSGLGASLLGAGLFGRRALGQTAGARRLVVFFTPNGTVHRFWRPEGSGTNFSFPAGSILEPLTLRRDKLVVIDGLDFKGTSNHEGGMSHMLTGGGGGSTATGGMSVDQYVAANLGGSARFSSLELGVLTSPWGGSTQTRMSYRGAGELVPPNDDPANVYRRLFGDVAGGPGQLDALLLRRKSVLDLARAEIEALRRKLGTEQARKLDAHVDALREVEVGLTAEAPSPDSCGSPGPIFEANPLDNDNFPAVGRAQMDLLALALSCGMTNAASLQWSHTVSPVVFSWLGVRDGHHALSHMDDGNSSGLADLVTTERWFAEQFGYFIDRLDSLPEPEGDGTLLDHTLVVWAKEMGDSRLHVCTSVPFVLAGGAGGRLSTGRYLRYDGEPHNKLLVSICHAMGLDNPTFGDPSHGTGALEGLLS